MDDSVCRKNIYCDFTSLRDLSDAVIEVCTQCGKKVVYNKIGKRIDNAKYLRDHIRSTIQPYGKTQKLFYKIYGAGIHQSVMRELGKKKTKAEIEQTWEQLRRDITKPD